jgi:hypothetical protein
MQGVTPVILDLCAGSGAWSLPYVERGYDVRRIDPARGTGDVRLTEYPGPVHGILAAPPCTVFAQSGARWPRSTQDYIEGLSVVDACLRLVLVCRPCWWVLENPVGKLRRWLGAPRLYFQPFEFGDPYTKKTCLWGDFTPPAKSVVFPSEGSKMHRMSSSHRAQRAVTPAGFARAFAEANP